MEAGEDGDDGDSAATPGREEGMVDVPNGDKPQIKYATCMPSKLSKWLMELLIPGTMRTLQKKKGVSPSDIGDWKIVSFPPLRHSRVRSRE